MLHTRLCEVLGIEFPIIAAPLGPDLSGPELVAAGGIAAARGVVAALALGAEAVVLGTRFLATPEARAHPIYKQKLVAATETDTVRTIVFGHGWPYAPHRALCTAFVSEWLGKEERGQESRLNEPVIGHTTIAGQTMPLLRFMGFPPNVDARGDIESTGLLAGQSVGLVNDIKKEDTTVTFETVAVGKADPRPFRARVGMKVLQ